MSIVHPSSSSAVNHTEKWLKEQARSGWRLIDKKASSYTFVKCRPYDTDYFIYENFNASKGVSFDFHMAKNLYANKHSEVNKCVSGLFEADIDKIDEKYYSYKALRNTYYKKHYRNMSILFGFMSLIAAIICFSDPMALLILLLPFIVFLFNFFSLLRLYKDAK